MLFLEEPIYQSFLPLVEHAMVGLPHPFGQLLQDEFSVLQADWGFTLCTTKVQRIVTLIIGIIFVVEDHRQWGLVLNPFDICCPQFRRLQELFR